MSSLHLLIRPPHAPQVPTYISWQFSEKTTPVTRELGTHFTADGGRGLVLCENQLSTHRVRETSCWPRSSLKLRCPAEVSVYADTKRMPRSHSKSHSQLWCPVRSPPRTLSRVVSTLPVSPSSKLTRRVPIDVQSLRGSLRSRVEGARELESHGHM